MSINAREKEEILARARLHNYRLLSHQSYSDNMLNTIILGEHDLTREARTFQDNIVAILKPHVVIHYLNSTDGERSAHFDAVRNLWSQWHKRWGTEVTGIQELAEDEAPPWCDNREFRAQLIQQVPKRGIAIVKTIEKHYADGQSPILAIVSARDVLRGSLACRLLRDDGEDGKAGDGITHVIIELHHRASR